jgi:hypothetical protein
VKHPRAAWLIGRHYICIFCLIIIY